MRDQETRTTPIATSHKMGYIDVLVTHFLHHVAGTCTVRVTFSHGATGERTEMKIKDSLNIFSFKQSKQRLKIY